MDASMALARAAQLQAEILAHYARCHCIAGYAHLPRVLEPEAFSFYLLTLNF